MDQAGPLRRCGLGFKSNSWHFTELFTRLGTFNEADDDAVPEEDAQFAEDARFTKVRSKRWKVVGARNYMIMSHMRL